MKNVKLETVVRTAILLAALVNQTLCAFGKNPLPFSDQQIYSGLSAAAAAAASVWSWWKNNSFTSAAVGADVYKDVLKEIYKNVG